MKQIYRLLLVLLLSAWGVDAPASPAVALSHPHENPIGRFVTVLKENGHRLTLAEAITAYQRGEFTPYPRPVLAFGIGARPVWLHFSVNNDTMQPVRQRLSIDTAWLDAVDLYFQQDGKTAAAYHVGDRKPFAQRPLRSRYFVFDHTFPPGASDLFIRVQTPDPMVVPIYLSAPPQAQARELGEDYSYGLLYGFLFALLAYNFMLYAGLREPRYLLYALYLGMFMLMNFSYTGHGFEWLWPNDTGWAQWSQPTLMMLYASSGLLFALSFLQTRVHFPRLHRAVLGYIGVGAALLLLARLFDAQREALLLAFTYVTLFTTIMLGMGVLSVRAGITAARYFLLAAVSAMVGAALTAMAVWGIIPFNLWTFRAVDIGMLLDATLLALALAYQFRLGQTQRELAMRLSRTDPLTGVNNRRAFYDLSAPIWGSALRYGRDLSVILLDLDQFKRINDSFGHACGDEALKTTAKVIQRCVREHDLIARWGGEEFLLLLPETDIEQATALAERLRRAIADNRPRHQGQEIAITASMGVATMGPRQTGLEELISIADKRLYRAKAAGRNRVCTDGPQGEGGLTDG